MPDEARDAVLREAPLVDWCISIVSRPRVVYWAVWTLGHLAAGRTTGTIVVGTMITAGLLPTIVAHASNGTDVNVRGVALWCISAIAACDSSDEYIGRLMSVGALDAVIKAVRCNDVDSVLCALRTLKAFLASPIHGAGTRGRVCHATRTTLEELERTHPNEDIRECAKVVLARLACWQARLVDAAIPCHPVVA